jgi:hypothetical protein
MGKQYTQLSLNERIFLQSQLELGFRPAAASCGATGFGPRSEAP